MPIPELSANKIEQTRKDWEKIAKETLVLEQVKGVLYAFGSELAALRLYYKFRHSKGARAEYSSNLRSWYFSLE